MAATSLDHYRLLGRSGLRVSPLSLGGMNFGTDWGFGTDEPTTRRIFDTYVERGGNFIDTANLYTNGTSERLLGRMAEGRRDRLVLATKYTGATIPGDPNSGGNHRKSMMRSIEGSLKRLGTDYIDLFYLHIWDDRAPVEEVMRGFDDLVRQGKVLYVGISDTPAWQVSRMQTIADLRGWAPLVALQIEYSLAQRTVERDLIPMAREMGLGVVPWGPLGGGMLTGKYRSAGGSNEVDSLRQDQLIALGRLTDRSIGLGEAVKTIAVEIGRSPAQVALAWVLRNPAVTSPIIGVRSVEQLEDNLGALDLELDPAHLARLDAASHVDLGFPHEFLQAPMLDTIILGGKKVERRR